MKTQQQTADVIFDFLNNLIYAPDKAVIKPDDLPEEYADVTEGLMLLQKWMAEARRFATAVGNGNINVTPPDSDNILAQPIKLLQSNLVHLTWQAREIAKGDYEQKVDFLGDFSTSFNLMITQLKDRRNKLQEDLRTIETQNKSLIGIRDFFFNFSDSLQKSFFIFDGDYNITFCNTVGRRIYREEPTVYDGLLQQIKSKEETQIWEFTLKTDDGLRWFEIERIEIYWQGTKETGCLIDDISKRKEAELAKDKMAFEDQMTGLYNRRYGMEQLQILLDDETPFCLAFIDLDQLKYINDTFGHSAGDICIKNVAHSFKKVEEEHISVRMGGDEFMVLVKDIKKTDLEKELESIRARLKKIKFGDTIYTNTFSYGVVESEKGWDSSSLLRKADKIMYDYKFAHKVKTRKS